MKKQNGFTLIETLVYLALFTIIIGGALVGVYQIIQGTNATQKKIVIEEEGNFLVRKLNWALTNATAINSPGSPGVAGTGDTLSLTKSDLTPSENPLVFSVSSGNLQLKRGDASMIALNGNNVTITNFNVVHSVPPGKTESVAISFTVVSSINGVTNTQNFQTTKYLRQ